MSLIDEALKRARMEAAQRAAEKEGLPYPAIPRHRAPRRRPLWLGVAVVALAVVAGVALGRWLVAGGPAAARPVAETVDAGGAQAATPAVEAADAGGAEAVNAMPAGRALEAPVTEPPPPTTEPGAFAPPAGGPPRMPAADEPTRPPVASPPPAAPPAPEPPPAAAPEVDPPPAAAPPVETPAANAPAPVPTPAATTVREARSGILLVLPPGTAAGAGGGAADEPAPEPPPEETHVQLYSIPGGGAIELGGIAWSESGPFALINGRVLGPGSAVESFTLERIGPGHVVLAGQGRRIRIELQ